ncbi:Translocation and assembly module subunit TamB [Halioglobus japonicus]|nr:Translocation and assembly module subunit TamB [Halioglobus japonicus]
MNWFRRSLLALLLLVPVALCLAIVLVLYTPAGARSVVYVAERLLPLQIDYRSGNLSGLFYLNRLRYDAEGLHLNLHDIAAELDADCLWRAAICFKQLQVGELDLSLLADAASEQDSPAADSLSADTSLVVFPVPVEAKTLSIGALRVGWDGGQWRQGELRGSVRLHQSSIEVQSGRIEEPELTLFSSDSAPPPESGTITLPRIDLPMTLAVNALHLINPAWNFYGAQYQQDELTLRGEWQRTALSLNTLQVQSAELGGLLLSGKLEFADDWPLQAEVAIDLQERFQYPELFNGALALSAGGDLSALALRLSSEGGVSVQGEGEVNVLSPALPFSMAVTATSSTPLTLAEFDAVPDVLSDAALAFPLSLTARGSMESQHFELLGASSGLGYELLQIAVQGRHENAQLLLSDIAVQSAEGDNELHASGELRLSPEISWSLALQTSGLDLPAISDVVKGRVDGSVQLAGSVQGERWQLEASDVAVQGQINDMPASILGFTGLDSDFRLFRSDLQAQLNGAQLSVQSPGQAVGPAHVRLKVEDIGRWFEDSSGLLEVDADVTSYREQVQLRGQLQQLHWSAVNIGQASFTGRFDASAGQSFSLDAVLSDVKAGALTFSEMQLSANGDAQAQSIALTSRGDVEGELNVSGTGTANAWKGALAPTRLRTPVGEWVLAESVAMSGSRAEDAFTVAGHCWRHEFAQVCPGNLVLGARGNGSIQLDGDLEILAGVLPPDIDLTGDVTLQLDARWTPESPVTVSGRAESGAVVLTQYFEGGESADFGWDMADVSVRSSGQGLQLDVGVQRDRQRILALDLLLPPDRAQAISGSVTVDQMRLAGLTPFVPALSELAGELSGKVSLAGTIDKPQGFGALTLQGGHLALEGNPTVLEDLRLTLDVQGSAANIVGTGVLGGGSLEISGSVESTPDLVLELDIRGENQSILYPPTTELLVSEALQLTLKRDLLILTGKLTVLEGLLEIEELPEGSVALSSSVVEVNSAGEVIREQLPFKVRMNVQIHIENRLRVTGSMVETRLGGDLRLQQRPGQPLQLFGSLNTDGGEFRAYQARLQIKRGSISFTGPPDNPAVNVRAERRINNSDVTVGVHVQGPLQDNLQLDIYSDPSMGQAETMSYLIRGRGIDAGAGVDGTTAALSLASGVVNRSELVNELNRIPGLSHVEFGAEGSETDATATVSGYFGERLYLSYGVGVYEPVNVLTTRFYFRTRLWLEVVSSIENSVDLYYSFDID